MTTDSVKSTGAKPRYQQALAIDPEIENTKKMPGEVESMGTVAKPTTDKESYPPLRNRAK
ncbi:MAG: hypothetical protein Kow0074_04540 [Candidatus Zixiibacteriota bacterium]